MLLLFRVGVVDITRMCVIFLLIALFFRRFMDASCIACRLSSPVIERPALLLSRPNHSSGMAGEAIGSLAHNLPFVHQHGCCAMARIQKLAPTLFCPI